MKRGGSVCVAVEMGSGLQLHLLRCFLHGAWLLTPGVTSIAYNTIGIVCKIV